MEAGHLHACMVAALWDSLSSCIVLVCGLSYKPNTPLLYTPAQQAAQRPAGQGASHCAACLPAPMTPCPTIQPSYILMLLRSQTPKLSSYSPPLLLSSPPSSPPGSPCLTALCFSPRYPHKQPTSPLPPPGPPATLPLFISRLGDLNLNAKPKPKTQAHKAAHKPPYPSLPA